MKKIALFMLVIMMVGMISTARAEEETVRFGRFGTVHLVRTSPQPSHIALFMSGDGGGCEQRMVDMARAFADLDTLVVVIDINYYLKELEKSGDGCAYPAADLEMLSKFIQKKLNWPRYVIPLLIGYSSGATLVYAVVAQAPPNTFCGAISLGFCPDFCPDIVALHKPLCRGYGLEWKTEPRKKGCVFLPAANLQVPWIVLQGITDQVCEPATTKAFVKQVKGGEIILLPTVGHGFCDPPKWMPQVKPTFLRVVANDKPAQILQPLSLKDLPLVEVPSQGPQAHNVLAVVISGDGGWAGIDRDIADTLSSKGVSVVGLNSLQYFWKRRTPEESSRDLERIISHYLVHWRKEHVILIGYSLGADVLPFMANRLPREVLDHISLIALLGPDEKIDFEFHLSYWLGGSAGSHARPVFPEVVKLKGKKILCFCGTQETDSLCHKMDASLAKTITLKGRHHFGGDYEGISETILKESRTNDGRS
jgi:type IV secretory pathway VirJ component